jgi:hypothetical protein
VLATEYDLVGTIATVVAVLLSLSGFVLRDIRRRLDTLEDTIFGRNGTVIQIERLRERVRERDRHRRTPEA